MIENINENSNYEFDMNEKDFDTSYDNEYEKLIFENIDDDINVEKTKEMTSILSKKTRRQKKSDNGKDEHTKYFFDNQSAKILVHSYKFIIQLSNAFLKSKNIKHEFFPLSGDFTKQRDLTFLKNLINKPIKYILEQSVSKKLYKLNHNKVLINNLIGIDQFNEFFNLKYKYIYLEFFLTNNKNKLFNDFGIESNIKMLDDFIMYLRSRYEEKYVDKIKETCINFISHIESTTPKKKK